MTMFLITQLGGCDAALCRNKGFIQITVCNLSPSPLSHSLPLAAKAGFHLQMWDAIFVSHLKTFVLSVKTLKGLATSRKAVCQPADSQDATMQHTPR